MKIKKNVDMMRNLLSIFFSRLLFNFINKVLSSKKAAAKHSGIEMFAKCKLIQYFEQQLT